MSRTGRGVSAFVLCFVFLGIMPQAEVSADTGSADPPAGQDAAFLHQAPEETGISADSVFLPTGDLFRSLFADPKEPRFYLSYRMFDYRSKLYHVAVGGYGEFFGLYRSINNSGGYSWQASFGGGIHGQFDLGAPSLDLVNADYTIGFPVSFRKGAESYRIALYHQSSHLGDEFLIHNNVQRIELSFEALELIGSYEWKTWRTYYGGEYIVHQGPTGLKPVILHGGCEYYGAEKTLGQGRLVGGWDLKVDQEHAWSVNSSVKMGLQFDGTEQNGHYIRVLAEGYKGFTPYGQFYNDRTSYVGVGVYLGFE